MRFLIVFLFAACFTLSARAQSGNVYVYKKDWSAAKNMTEAVYFMQDTKENDSLYVCRYYRKNGPMIRWVSFSDPDFKTPHGLFAWYNEEGEIDSSGRVANGVKDRLWSYGRIGDHGMPRITELYQNGVMQKRVDYATRTVTYNDGTTESLDMVRERDSLAAKANPMIQVPAEFNGGLKAWSKYLSSKTVTPDRFKILNIERARAVVVASFYINKQGAIEGVFIEKSVEWSVDMETIRVLKNAPNWKPATQNGKEVMYRHKQSITFSPLY